MDGWVAKQGEEIGMDNERIEGGEDRRMEER